MALGATVYTIDIDLADADRSVYESLALRVARHPSESEEYLVTRLIAYLMEYAAGIEFSRGVSEPDQPAVLVRDLTGAIT
ncbi:MAG TPA: YaeQ family protein, partial [Vicinamibacterales bacterium]|nr:YaeQ family protein [Vicinamibacterales bacterium]